MLKRQNITGFRPVYLQKTSRIYQIIEKECHLQLTEAKIGTVFCGAAVSVSMFFSIGCINTILLFPALCAFLFFLFLFIHCIRCCIQKSEVCLALEHMEGMPCRVHDFICGDHIGDCCISLEFLINERMTKTEYFLMDNKSADEWANDWKKTGIKPCVHLIRCGNGSKYSIYRVFYSSAKA